MILDPPTVGVPTFPVPMGISHHGLADGNLSCCTKWQGYTRTYECTSFATAVQQCPNSAAANWEPSEPPFATEEEGAWVSMAAFKMLGRRGEELVSMAFLVSVRSICLFTTQT